ncbi:hypothetical protein CSOJ01_13713 [Colletotrichum sojae]|uniref:DUF7708 domain-containing protein n=1 Tax=Colletotrichum sojae TaxID=2175907 RepID=A0A8H6ISA4_9PEZI|nr:hypothetical protein CSOJ01_13713 [Colletotrichum sojae]
MLCLEAACHMPLRGSAFSFQHVVVEMNSLQVAFRDNEPARTFDLPSRPVPPHTAAALVSRWDAGRSNLPTLSPALWDGNSNTHSQWYIGDTGQRWTDPAQAAYDSAVDILRKELTADEYQDIQKIGHNSLKDVQTAVGAALEGYQKRTKGHKVRAWLASCSSRVMYYGGQHPEVSVSPIAFRTDCGVAIFDTFAQHHPEYVSLAWGTLKFLFVVRPYCSCS